MALEPKNEEAFLEVMEEVDGLLKSRNIPICNRPIHAPIEIAKSLKISIPLVPIEGNAVPGVYHGDSLSAHIHNWKNVKERKRDRQTILD